MNTEDIDIAINNVLGKHIHHNLVDTSMFWILQRGGRIEISIENRLDGLGIKVNRSTLDAALAELDARLAHAAAIRAADKACDEALKASISKGR